MKKIKEHINAFLGKDSEFEGKFSFSGTVRIDGSFKGEIFTGDTLMIGEEAVVESEIHASHVIISGEVRGNVIAENKIEMLSPAKVFGNIQAPVITIEAGVIFEGTCQMQKQIEKAANKVAVLPKGKTAAG